MAPVINARDDETEQKKTGKPPANLAENLGAIRPASALTIIKKRAYEGAYGRGGSDRKLYAGHVGEHVRPDAAYGIDGEHPADTEFLDHQGGNSTQGHHIEDDMQYPAVQVICTEK